jgi:hypothetical protein
VALKILVPVLPSDRFYDAVVGAADVLAREGGSITFLFPTVRPPPNEYDDYPAQHESELDVPPEGPYEAGPAELVDWQVQMIAGLEDARQLLSERGIGEDQLNYLFADHEEDALAHAIADEAASGGFDMVVLSRGEFINLPDMAQQSPRDIAAELEEWKDEGVKLLVT